MIIGVISDTHGVLRPEALAALQGSQYIIHAGDVGDSQILDRLAAIAPVTAVRGNVDQGAWARKIPATNVLAVGGVSIYVLHVIQELDLKPEAANFAAIVYGHSHTPKQELKNGVLYFNPGSAGPRRFRLPASVGRLTIDDGKIDAKILLLETITLGLEQRRRPRRPRPDGERSSQGWRVRYNPHSVPAIPNRSSLRLRSRRPTDHTSR